MCTKLSTVGFSHANLDKVSDYIFSLQGNWRPTNRFRSHAGVVRTEHSNTPRFVVFAPIPKCRIHNRIADAVQRIYRHRDRKQLPFIHAVEL